MTSPLAAARAALRPLHRTAEPEALAALLPAATLDPAGRARVRAAAAALLKDLRAAAGEGWVNKFLQVYRLDTQEGTALLALAEAFLRVPDPETADLLIRDKLGAPDWSAQAGASDSLLVSSAAWGLVMARAVVGEDHGPLRRLIRRAGEPFVRTAVGAAMRLMGQAFVTGRTIEEALERMRGPDVKGFTASFDMLGEAARTQADAARYFAAYQGAIRAVGAAPDGRRHSISVKLSALHPRYETARAGQCAPELAEMLIALGAEAAAAGIGLTVDAEESERLEMSLDIIEAAARSPRLSGWDGLGMAIQAYGKRARAVVAFAQALAQETKRKLNTRLVKGAYWDSEIKRTQELGLSDYPLFTRKAATDVSYLACAKDMLAASHLAPAFASHNALTVATILDWAGARRDFEFQRLHGMGEGLYERLVREEGHACRIYAPVGGHRDLLAYLVRRLLENGANSSFVHKLGDADVSEEELLADPAEAVAAVGGAPHPRIPRPAALFGADRRNSSGIDLADAQTLADLGRDLAAAWATPWRAAAVIDGKAVEGAERAVRDPSDQERVVGFAVEASPADAARAVERAAAGFGDWSRRPVAERAAILEKLAALLEANRTELMALAIREAGKTIPDALAEVREAVDFCRYYALNARAQFAPVALPGPTGERNEVRLEGRGVFACIAPWNFPLAIFLGQIAAALVSGNTVVAKPAPQTPLIAARAVMLAHEAGVPTSALQFAPGGPEVGRALVEHPRVAGVAFTGSTATAKAIARALVADDARPIAPLIAETGGINAMIVDSTALPEQVVADVVASAFRSAGQRCSALRLLLLQEEIAERTLEMLFGAMDLLRIGDPGDPATDVGPVIDAAARDKLEAHLAASREMLRHSVQKPTTRGFFVAPSVLKIETIEGLSREWFGPILHVATWRAGRLEETIARVNASGYGLTMGLQSRIAAAADAAIAGARVGNLYVNRSMIGAVVGSQPFGGEGLSGTGPKAGGPHYLYRFAVERAVSIDTTSAGGNASLLSLDDGD